MTLFAHAKALPLVLLISLTFALPSRASGEEINPLRPVDTSSPRAALEDFTSTMDDIYRGMKDVIHDYRVSGRLYLTADQRRRQFDVLSKAPKAIRILDLSDIPPILRDTVAPERAIQLKEILDRIEVPPTRAFQTATEWPELPPSDGGCQEPRLTLHSSRAGRAPESTSLLPKPSTGFPNSINASASCRTSRGRRPN